MAITLAVVAPGLGPAAAATPRGPHKATGRPACGPVGSAGPPPPNDPYWSSQWNLCRIRAPAAWTVSTGRGVRIGIVDTGVDRTQPDLSAKVVATADCLGADGDPGRCRTGPGAARDDNGHGTAVAGLAAATTNNDLGVAGTAPAADLVVAKALTARGSGTFGDVNAGIEWTVNHGAQVVNLSLGAGGPVVAGPAASSTSLLPGIDYAWSHGAVPVLAAGNTDALGQATTLGNGSVPALVVGATGPEDRPAPYSSPTGDAPWALVAPGGSAGP
ncbi:MAG TPA: S8 family serine peptidase, partial [Acidimicrobiales bacterium]|nr:S8 family serine peptidase [Acidimicrobiales bacterium]